MKRYVTLLLLFSVCSGELLRPIDGQELHYVHVLFEWDQEADALYYQLELVQLNSNETVIFDSIKTNLFVERSSIAWDRIYQWRIRAIKQDNEYGDWIGPLMFNTIESKLRNINITIYQDSLMQPGLTIFGGPNPLRHTAVVDRDGKEIWNDGEYSFKINHVDEYGALYGNSDDSYPDRTASKINYDMDFIWSSEQEVDPHDIRETPRNTFLALRNVFSNGPIPSNISKTDEFRDLGFLADDTTNEFPWFAQEIIEFDQENNIIWSWNPFDHFSMEDHDMHGHTWHDAFIAMKYDWTHSNSIFFDDDESAIYLSSRHLSRISKIDYPSGELIYNISLPSPYIASGDSGIGNDLLFNFQHHIERIGNGNFTLFDNGNISDQLFDHGHRVSRALEFEVIGDTVCNMVWSYSLPTNLYGRAGGSVQVLKNNNRLIYTRGNSFGGINNPTIIEMTNDQSMVWKLTASRYYAWYRSFRIPSIHPDAFSVVVRPYSSIDINDDKMNGVIIDSDGIITISVKNESGYSQPYFYKIKDDRRWIEPVTGIDTIDAGQLIDIQLELSTAQGREMPYSNLEIIVTPIKHSYAKKQKTYMLFDRSNFIESDIDSQMLSSDIDNIPNPFNPTTNIKYDLLKSAHVRVTVYDIMGRQVEVLFDGVQKAGHKSILWNSNDNTGLPISTGLYFYTIEAGSDTKVGKMLLVK